MATGPVSFRLTSYLSLFGIVVVLGIGFLFLAKDKTAQLDRLYPELEAQIQTTGAVVTSVGDAAGSAMNNIASNLSSNLQGAGASLPYISEAERFFTDRINDKVTFELLDWDGTIFETLTPYETLLAVQEYRAETSKGALEISVISRVDAQIEDVYSFVKNLALGANSNDKVLIQETKQLEAPSFYYIHLDKSDKVRIVTTVTETIAIAIDGPVALSSDILAYLRSLN